MGFGDRPGSKLSTQKTYLADAHGHGAPTSSSTAAPSGSWSRAAAPPGWRARWIDPERGGERHRARVAVRAPVVVVACGSIESPGAAAALRDRRPRGRRVPAAASHGRGHRRLPRGPGLVVGPAAGGDLPPVRRPRGRLRLPDRVGAVDDGAVRGGARPGSPAATTRRRCSTGAACAPFINLIRDRGHGRVDGRRRRERGRSSYRLTDELDVAQLPPRARRADPPARGAGAERIVSARPQARPIWERGDDLDAFIDAVTAHSLAPREYAHLHRPPDGELPDGRRPGDERREPAGASSTTRRACGSATRAPSRPPPASTRWSRSWRWPADRAHRRRGLIARRPLP